MRNKYGIECFKLNFASPDSISDASTLYPVDKMYDCAKKGKLIYIDLYVESLNAHASGLVNLTYQEDSDGYGFIFSIGYPAGFNDISGVLVISVGYRSLTDILEIICVEI